METVSGYSLVLLLLVVLFYFYPTVVARQRWSPHWAGVLVVNILLGWTFVGWVIALAWAFSGENIRKRTMRERRERRKSDTSNG